MEAGGLVQRLGQRWRLGDGYRGGERAGGWGTGTEARPEPEAGGRGWAGGDSWATVAENR